MLAKLNDCELTLIMLANNPFYPFLHWTLFFFQSNFTHNFHWNTFLFNTSLFLSLRIFKSNFESAKQHWTESTRFFFSLAGENISLHQPGQLVGGLETDERRIVRIVEKLSAKSLSESIRYEEFRFVSMYLCCLLSVVLCDSDSFSYRAKTLFSLLSFLILFFHLNMALSVSSRYCIKICIHEDCFCYCFAFMRFFFFSVCYDAIYGFVVRMRSPSSSSFSQLLLILLGGKCWSLLKNVFGSFLSIGSNGTVCLLEAGCT